MVSEEAKKYKSNIAHFSFGNDKAVLHSSYQSDFGLHFQAYMISGKPNPPTSAQILPNEDRKAEAHKWVSSTMRDYAGFGNDSRRHAYEVSRGGFQQAKGVQTKNAGLLTGNSMPMTTRYVTDFRQPSTSAPQLPECMLITKNALKASASDKTTKNDQMVSEARHAFQWPSSERLKLPSHFKRTM